MKSDCVRHAALVPGYLDGELSDEQATPLRRHLLSCPRCRSEAQDLTMLRRWFPSPPEIAVPTGFAARVARLAFDGGSEGATGSTTERTAADKDTALAAGPVETPSLMHYLLVVTSIAAGLLMTFALVLGMRQQPRGEQLSAEPLHAILQELDELNAQGGQPTAAPEPDPEPGTGDTGADQR